MVTLCLSAKVPWQGPGSKTFSLAGLGHGFEKMTVDVPLS